MSIAQKQAEIQRAEAKRLINKAFKVEENTESELLNRLIDCIIGAAILEITAIYQEASQKESLNKATSDNP